MTMGLRDFAARVHGGPDGGPAPLHDFSTNGNACGPCPTAVEALQQADATRYPDPGYRMLRAQLAAFHGVTAWRIVPAASASEFIFRITAWVARQGGRSVSLPAQAYGDYAHAAQAFGLRPVVDAPGAGDACLTWLCDPSSPQGASQPTLQPGFSGLVTHQGVVVLDRAYEPLRLGGTPCFSPAQCNTVWQLWTPNKALGLTGVRAAYAIAPLHAEGAAQALENAAPSWPIGAHGVAMLQAWCAPEAQAWLDASRQMLRAWKARQLALCKSLGWSALASDANFFCAAGPDVPALRAFSIQLRDTASFGLPGLARLSVQSPAAQDALKNAWCLVQQNRHQ